MAATKYDALILAARFHLNAARGSNSTYKTDKFWSDDELLSIALRGTTDLWAGVIDLNEEHFLTVDEDHVSITSGESELDGVPADTFRVYLIEPLDTTETGTSRFVTFVPRDYNHPEFIAARAWSGLAPTDGINIFFAMSGQGAPNNAPIVRIAPTLSMDLDLRFVYIPTLGVSTYDLNSSNPIPGESDHAIIAWIVAYARSKERDDRSPDPAWLAVYATEKQSLLTRMIPRQVQEPQVVDGVFDGYWR